MYEVRYSGAVFAEDKEDARMKVIEGLVTGDIEDCYEEPGEPDIEILNRVKKSDVKFYKVLNPEDEEADVFIKEEQKEWNVCE